MCDGGENCPIIAPFFADVDTTGMGSGLVQYGNATINGFSAFVANYLNVGYFAAETDKLNSFQVALLDRSDTGAGNFDIWFNYGSILWETGDVSGGTDGLGGTSAGCWVFQRPDRVEQRLLPVAGLQLVPAL